METAVVAWYRTMAFLSATVLLSAACTQDQPVERGKAAKIPLAVYFQGPLTGRYSYLAIHAFRAAKLRFDELNAEADFPAEVTLERANVRSDLDTVEVPPVVAADPNAVAVLGPTSAGGSEAGGRTYNDAGIPFVTPSDGNPMLAEKGWAYWYRTVANYNDEGLAIGGRMAQEFRSIYVAHDRYRYARELAEVVASVAAENGTEVVALQGIDTEQEDYSNLISDVEASRAEALFYGSYDARAGLLVAQAREAALDIPIWSGEASVSEVLLDVAGDAATNMVLACPCNLQSSGDFLGKYESTYGDTAVPLYAAEGYDAASLVAEGVRSAIDGGADDPAAIREGIKEYFDGLTIDRPFQGVAKEIAFNPESHELAAEDRRALIFFYTVQPGTVTLDGSAAELAA